MWRGRLRGEGAAAAHAGAVAHDGHRTSHAVGAAVSAGRVVTVGWLSCRQLGGSRLWEGKGGGGGRQSRAAAARPRLDRRRGVLLVGEGRVGAQRAGQLQRPGTAACSA